MKEIVNILKNTANITEATIEYFDQRVQCVSVKKGTILQQEGDSTRKAFYVIKGLLKSYFLDSDGREHIFMFAPEKWLVLDAKLIFQKTPAVLYVAAIEDSEVEIMDGELFENIEKLPSNMLDNEIRKLLNRIIVLQDRIKLLMSASAAERYNHFLATYPSIVQRVTQKMIASYLGITPEALSKIRKKMTARIS